MLFNSLEFLIFFPVVTLLYFLLPHRFRWLMLLTASCVFYMAFIPVYILILAVTIVIDYLAGIFIEKAEGRRKKAWLIISILSTCLVLFAFKYFNFFNGAFMEVAHLFHLHYPIGVMKIILPIGLSFHTFQSLSYVIEVYRGNQKAEKHFGIYALYVMFYPQLVAGPIERPQNLLHQFREKHVFNYDNVTSGLRLIAWGLFKKCVIADRVAMGVTEVYDHPHTYSGLSLVLATVFFAIQIYCDFSGYSDIARGTARVMGFRLMENFNRPYFSKSVSEFWKRWHISLSTWFKDYLYIPLGGNRKGWPRWQFNLMITFLISGLWHGANWTFLIWGGMNGFYLLFETWTTGIRKWVLDFLRISRVAWLKKILTAGITFCFICLAWVFFRAKNVSDGMYIITHIFSGWGSALSFQGAYEKIRIGMDAGDILIAFAAIALMEVVHLLQRKGRLSLSFVQKPAWFRWTGYFAITLLILFFGVFRETNFIYFQF